MEKTTFLLSMQLIIGRIEIKDDLFRRLRETAQLSGISKTSISEYLVRFRRSRISYDESLNLSDTELIELLEEKKQEESEQYTTLVSLFPEYSRRLKKRGMTKQLLWKERLQKELTLKKYLMIFCKVKTKINELINLLQSSDIPTKDGHHENHPPLHYPSPDTGINLPSYRLRNQSIDCEKLHRTRSRYNFRWNTPDFQRTSF
jgi:predicted transcriptional regulator